MALTVYRAPRKSFRGVLQMFLLIPVDLEQQVMCQYNVDDSKFMIIEVLFNFFNGKPELGFISCNVFISLRFNVQ